MNKFYCIGTLISKPYFSNKEGKKPFCYFYIRTDDSSQPIKVKCYDDIAIDCEKYLSENRKVFIEGRAYAETYKIDQQVYAQLLVKADNVEFLRKKA